MARIGLLKLQGIRRGAEMRGTGHRRFLGRVVRYSTMRLQLIGGQHKWSETCEPWEEAGNGSGAEIVAFHQSLEHYLNHFSHRSFNG